MTFNGARHELELRADVARDRLLETIGAIDRRRHEVLDWKLQLRQHVGQAARMGAVLVGGMALVLGAGLYHAKRLAAHRRRERMRALGRFWEHPERVAMRRRRPIRSALLSVFVTLVAVAAAKVARSRS